MRFASLGSGSEGNALVVEASAGNTVTRVLLDCGFSLRETERRLARLGIEPQQIDAIIVTHEHGDHIGGVPRFARKHGTPVWITYGTCVASGMGGVEGLRGLGGAGASASAGTNAAGAIPVAIPVSAASAAREIPPEIHLIEHHAPFVVGALQMLPFPVPHDAREPAQYVFSDGTRRLGVLTDLGSVTAHVTSMLSRCDGLVLECNHDAQMLAASAYPPGLKARVGGAYGHLNNQQAAQLLGEIKHAGLQHVMAAHLSAQNNTPALARAALADALGCAPEWVGIADQADGFDWRSL